MRDLFTIVAMLIVTVLFAALAVPYFVNWEAHREEVEAVLGNALGIPVRTQGVILVRLLPTPHLALEQVEIGPEKPLLTAQALSISLEVPPLLSGQIKVTRAQLLRPIMRVEVGRDGALHLPSAQHVMMAEAVGINNLQVEEGAIHLISAVDGKMHESAIGPINITASAARLVGPWRVDGDVAGYGLHLAAGVPDAQNQMRFKLRLQYQDKGAPSETYGELDGLMQIGEKPSIQGKLTAAYPFSGWPASGAKGERSRPTNIIVTANIQNEGWRITGKELEFRLGEGLRALQLTGTGALDVGVLLAGRQPRLEMQLNSRRLDWASFPQSEKMEAGDIVSIVSSSLQKLPIDLALHVGGIAIGGQEFGPLSAELRSEYGANNARIDISRLSLTLPGGTMQGHGVISLLQRPSVAGFLQLAGTDTSRLANALSGAGIPSNLINVLPRSTDIQIAGNMEASQEGFAVRELQWISGKTSIHGALNYVRQSDHGRGRLEAQLTADGLDLTLLPAFAPERFIFANTDLDIALEADHLQFGNHSDTSDKRLSAHFRSSADEIMIDHFEVSDLDKLHLQASGKLDERGGRIAASLKAENADTVMMLSRPFLAREWTVWLSHIKPSAGPLGLEATIERPEGNQPLVAHIEGAIAGAAINATLRHNPSGSGNDRAGIDMTMEHPQPITFLSNLGIINNISGWEKMQSPARLTVTARGAAFANLDGRADATWSSNRLSFRGQWDNAALTGKVAFESPGLGPLASVIYPSEGAAKASAELLWNAEAIYLTNLHGSIAGKAVAGSLSYKEGALAGKIELPRLDLADLLVLSLGKEAFPAQGQKWSSARFNETPMLPRASLHIRTGQLGITDSLGFKDASLQLDLSPNTVNLQNISGQLPDNGKMTADIALRRWGSQASLRASARLDGVSISTLMDNQWPGKVSGVIDVGASAQNVAGLIANIAGGGELHITQTTVPHLDPDALNRLVPDLIKADASLSQPRIVARRLEEALDENAWPVANITFPLTVVGGIVRYGPLMLDAQQARASLNGMFDINRLYFDTRAHLTAKVSPEGWNSAPPQAIITWRGQKGAIVRNVDAGSTANGLAAIALTRELDRIERLEAEARQRMEKARAKREQERLEQQKREALRLKEEAEKKTHTIQDSVPPAPEGRPGTQLSPSGFPVKELDVSPLDLRPGALYR